MNFEDEVDRALGMRDECVYNANGQVGGKVALKFA